MPWPLCLHWCQQPPFGLEATNLRPTHAKPFQLCPSLCDPMDGSPPASTVPGILQARVLEGVAMPSSRGSSRPRDRTHVSYVSCISGWIPPSSIPFALQPHLRHSPTPTFPPAREDPRPGQLYLYLLFPARCALTL